LRAIKLMDFHTSRKNKYAARVGHPLSYTIHESA